MLKFDLNSSPPTIEQLGAEREILINQKAKLKRSLCVFVYAILATMGVSAYGLLPEIGPLMWMGCWIIFAIPLAILTNRKLLFISTTDERISALKPLPATSDKRSAKVFEYCCQNELCRPYLQAIVQQDRILTVGEADMIENWEKEAEARHAAERILIIKKELIDNVGIGRCTAQTNSNGEHNGYRNRQQ
jgi:hypothetical protein